MYIYGRRHTCYGVHVVSEDALLELVLAFCQVGAED